MNLSISPHGRLFVETASDDRRCIFGCNNSCTTAAEQHLFGAKKGLSAKCMSLHPRSRGLIAFIPIYPNALNCMPKPPRACRTLS